MAGLFRILIAAALVVHLAVGCCAHHAHGCDGPEDTSPAQCPATPDGHGRDTSGGHADHSHHGPDDCQGAKCSVVALSRPIRDTFSQPSEAFVVPVLDDEFASLTGILVTHRSMPSGRRSLPVRLHLANQVLLI